MGPELSEILKSLPPKPPRSRLEPYAALVSELRLQGWTYRVIASLLAEKCGLRVCASNIHHFVHARPVLTRQTEHRPTRTKPKDALGQGIGPPNGQRVDTPTEEPGFTFDPGEPLRIKTPEKRQGFRPPTRPRS